MLLRRTLLVILGLWVALGVALAPARPMPGMAMGPSPEATQPAAGAPAAMHRNNGHGSTKHKGTGHHDAGTVKSEAARHQNPPESERSSHAHQPNCVLCVVGAGTLALVVVVAWNSSPTRTVDLSVRERLEPRRFRHFRSRAPPALVSS